MRSDVLTDLFASAEVLIIVPPFAAIDRPSLGVHTLQACAREHGYRVDVFYASLLYAQEIGVKLYHSIAYGATVKLMGERIFAHAAYGHDKPIITPKLRELLVAEGSTPDEIEQLIDLARDAARWMDEVARELARLPFKIIGATSTFEQTAASLALINRVKRLRPDVTAIIGGANCEGPMATGMATLSPHLDYIFSGESETTFINFLDAHRAGTLPAEKIYYGEPNNALETVPCPDYTEFYAQMDAFVDPAQREGIELLLPYESSRGCWWGQKHHCVFCGLNGSGMGFRQKSADRILDDLDQLTRRHANKTISMVDNIMPNNYFKTFLPRLAETQPGYRIFYEQKANLDLRKVMLLHAAGIVSIQPGIEALSTPLLRLMDKGVSAAQNIALLRYCLINSVDVKWNLLCGFPGDQLEWYADTLRIVRLIPHLQPPSDVFSLTLDRFSPYFERAEAFGIRGVRPFQSYYDILPDTADIEAVAYHFTGAFKSDTYQHLDLINELRGEIMAWRQRWQDETAPRRILSITRAKGDLYVLKDTRGLPETKPFQFINREQAAVALTGLPLTQRASASWAWGVETRVAVELDQHLVPLAVADPALLLEFEGTRVPDLIMPA